MRVSQRKVRMTLGFKRMSYKFIGENIPELKEIPAEERRKVFLIAVAKSYIHGRTWFGLLLFFAAGYLAVNFAPEIAEKLGKAFSTPTRGEMLVNMGLWCGALLALYCFQIEAVKREIRKRNNPNKKNAAYG